jgi:hypothetical protein
MITLLEKETPMVRVPVLMILGLVASGCSSSDSDACKGSATQACDADGVLGTQTCQGGQWGACEANCTPKSEECNNKDDDCNGVIDDGADGKPLQVDCGTACGAGTAVCVAGVPMNCTAPQVKDEICDGLDNNCNGKVDEGFPCAVNATESCGSDTGACEYGTRTCSQFCDWGQCTGGVFPSTEVCEGSIDEDCDSTVDNGCGCTDGQQKDCCGGTKISCTGGTWPACPTPPAETCNDKDDDCNGKVDDNLPVNPYLLEEDVTKQDKCDLAKTPSVGALVPTGSTFEGYLYKQDGAADSDWYKFTTQEADGICVPTSDQCITTTFTLTEPTGKDYELCVRYDSDNISVTCTTGTVVCSTDSGQSKNSVVVKYDGICGLEDGIDYFLEVKPAQAGTTSCKPYKIAVTWASASGLCP